jgi:hypothetical protein
LFHRRSFFNLQDNGGMTFLTQLAQSTLAARLVCIVLLAALAGLVTDAVLKIVYGAPAPAVLAPSSVEMNAPTPNWLAGGVAALTAPSDLKLVGVIAQGASGIALIQQLGQRAQILHIGQKLADGTQLKSVQGKTATVLVNNALRTLNLEVTSATNLATVANNSNPSLNPIPMPDASAQVAQQMQQLQQAASGEPRAAQPTSLNEAPNNGGALKKRLGARP